MTLSLSFARTLSASVFNNPQRCYSQPKCGLLVIVGCPAAAYGSTDSTG